MTIQASTQTIQRTLAPRRDSSVATDSRSGAKPSAAYFAAKRSIDIFGALAGLLLLFPLYVALAVLVLLDSPGPVFHRRRVLAQQQKVGGSRQGNSSRSLATFDAFKFRTMMVNADAVLAADAKLCAAFSANCKLVQDPRITKRGRLLRRLSLDELPQLLNVLIGQMSLVGPRMIAPAELEKYGCQAEKLLSVKPGLTGLWQVSGRQRLAYQERIRLDMCYIDNRSITLDMLILARTLKAVITGDGAY